VKRALLVHGLSSGPDGWWRVRGWLEDAGWSTATVALRGHGGLPPAGNYHVLSYASDIAASGPWDLVIAHSLGGSAATIAAADDPAWTERLILLDPVWRIPDDEMDAVIDDQRSDLEYTRESLIAAKPHWDPRDIDAKLVAIAQVDPDAVVRTWTDTGSWDLTDAARALAIPTLVLGGDPAVYTMLEPADGRAIAADATDLEYVVVPGAGHSPHRDAPDATRDILTRWLSTDRKDPT
jgi:pimeloyl-ACP methyl ester carboxylesterase